MIGLAVAVGCKKEATGPGSAAPGEPSSTKEQDALWAMAPADASFGLVGSSRGVTLLEHGAVAIRAAIAAAPELAPVRTELEQAMTEATGAAQPALADLGLSHDKGFAVFVVGKHDPLIVVPVGDRDKFLAKLHGTKGGDVDKLSDLVCKPIADRYVCASRPEAFALLGHGGLDAARKAAGARGDLEAAYAGPAGPRVAAVLQLESGAFVLRGNVSGLPPEVSAAFGVPSKPRGDAATAAGFGVFDAAPLLSQIPAVPLAPNITAADLARSISGPLTFSVPAGTTNLDVRIPLGDTGPASGLLEHCATLPPLAALGATSSGGKCHIPVPQAGITLDSWVEGKELRIGLLGSGTPQAPAQTGIGALIANAPWSAAFYGRGALFAAKLPAAVVAALPPDSKLGLRALSVLNEVGVGLRKDGDGLGFVLGVRTMWSNPDDIVQKLLAIAPDQIVNGTAPEAAKAIADAAPSSPFAGDFRAGVGGGVAVMAPFGIVAAVAIPAFMDYTKRSKKTEAELQLNKIGKNAKRVYAETSTFPVGKAPLTPATSCCAGADHHCVTTAADWKQPAWQALDFEIDEPSLYRYSYTSDGKTFTAKAVGDLDCDGVEATYELLGVSLNGNPTVSLTRPAPGTN